MTRLRAITLGAIMLAAAGCTDDGDEVLLILHNQVPGEGCVISGDATAAFTPQGFLDVIGRNGYLFTPVVKNTVIASTALEATRTAIVTGARVQVRFADPMLFTEQEIADLDANGVTRFEAPQAGDIAPNGGTAPFAFDIIPASLTAALSDKIGNDASRRILVQADVTMRARLGGGTTESQTYTYSVNVCAGCLLRNLGQCSAFADTFTGAIGNPCNPFQDGGTECCSAQTGGLVCPAVGTKTSGG